MPDQSVVKQLFFAEGLVCLDGVVGRPLSTWRDRALVALRPVLTCQLRGGVGMGWLRTLRSDTPFVTAPRLLHDSLCLAALNTGISFVGSLPLTL
eukprot:354212-Chlamydomonas_euryale.AAC.17